mmetsp:Transcript_6376/g.15115  ORF Transcript_6376/g.15115 Transcript_6376/m.15115 type:complete len:215 (-) Transcript_6376:137-781(-)
MAGLAKEPTWGGSSREFLPPSPKSFIHLPAPFFAKLRLLLPPLLTHLLPRFPGFSPSFGAPPPFSASSSRSELAFRSSPSFGGGRLRGFSSLLFESAFPAAVGVVVSELMVVCVLLSASRTSSSVRGAWWIPSRDWLLCEVVVVFPVAGDRKLLPEIGRVIAVGVGVGVDDDGDVDRISNSRRLLFPTSPFLSVLLVRVPNAESMKVTRPAASN